MNAHSVKRHPLPLCAGYVGVMLDKFEVQPLVEGARAAPCFRWAIGLLADGQLEMLGAWSPCEEAGTEQQLFSDLKSRGVEAIRFVVSADPVDRADAGAAYPRVKVLPSFEALLRDSLRQVGPTHRRAVGRALRLIVSAESLDSASVALSAFAAGSLGHRYPTLVERWHRALQEAKPLFALTARQRRLLLLADQLVRSIHERLRCSRPILPNSASVSARVESALARIGHTLATQSAVRGFAGDLSHPVAGPLAAWS
jgi:transposase-like protein